MPSGSRSAGRLHRRTGGEAHGDSSWPGHPACPETGPVPSGRAAGQMEFLQTSQSFPVPLSHLTHGVEGR